MSKEPEAGGPDRVGASFGMKIGLPNYSSIDFALWHTTDVEPLEDPAEVRIQLLEKLKSEAREIARSIKGANPPKVP